MYLSDYVIAEMNNTPSETAGGKVWQDGVKSYPMPARLQ